MHGKLREREVDAFFIKGFINSLVYIKIDVYKRQGLGCNKTNRKYFKQMIEAGVEVKTFLPLSFPRFLRSVNYRNHKKIVIIDGRIAYTGGINVKDVYIDGLPWGKWNDIHFKVEGSGASGLQSVFLADWYYASGQYLSSPEYYPNVDVYKRQQ